MQLAGGCLCGAIRYRIDHQDGDVADYCHCLQCRRASGAPVTAWVQVPPNRFATVQGSAKGYASSDSSTRWFCQNCGSQLYMTGTDGRTVGVLTATLDDPAKVPPTVHGWHGERLAWFDTTDALPRFERHPPYDEQ